MVDFGSECVKVQGGSNMTGTDCGLFTPNQSRSYLNHLVYKLPILPSHIQLVPVSCWKICALWVQCVRSMRNFYVCFVNNFVLYVWETDGNHFHLENLWPTDVTWEVWGILFIFPQSDSMYAETEIVRTLCM
jgi:hypothetical protein